MNMPMPLSAGPQESAASRVRFETSPFDAIRHVDPDGEWWSARELMPLLGYERWERFVDAIERARTAARNSETTAQDHFRGAAKMVALGSGSTRAVADYRVSRYGAYLVAMNGDPRKPQIASAQTYFAVQTRRAEVAAAPLAVPGSFAEALELAARQARELETQSRVLEAQEHELQEAGPKVEAHDVFMDAAGAVPMGAAANMLGIGRTSLFRVLRSRGVLQRNNRPYQRYVHHFKVIASPYRDSGGVDRASYTTLVRPTGIEFIRRELGLGWITTG